MRAAAAAAAAVLLSLSATTARADFFSQTPGPLAAAHQHLEGSGTCVKCHTDGRNLDNERCLGCHDHEPIRRRIAQQRGLHASARVAGKACYLCHTEHKGRGRDLLGFNSLGGRERFDHQLTGWALAGKHEGVACARCHTQHSASGRPSFLGAPTSCDGCHKSPHGDLRAGLRRCERCHDTRSWAARERPEFDHNTTTDARFSVDGKHAGVPCLRCHEKWRFRAASPFGAPDCAPCHTNPHGDSLFGRKRCGLCHGARLEWTSSRFDHTRHTRFALDGGHAGKPCVTCHAPRAAARPERTCHGCHRDVHRGRFASVPGDCSTCHPSASWKIDSVRFDHGARTRFPLAGAHADATCRDCHRGGSPTEWEKFDKIIVKPVACMSCHKHEDVHKKQFPDAECLRCHVSPGKSKFRKEAIARFHGEGTRFPLDGGHAGVACDKCHKNDVYQGTPLVCGPACHPDQLHQGSLGTDCLRCHQGGRWAAARFDHDDSAYPLVGHHQEASCEGCHPARRFVPTERLCSSCHIADDAHQGTLGTRCERCHSPTGRSLFDHNDPKAPERFRLTGRHRQIRCQACHPTTVFPRVPTECSGCHADPAKHRGQLGRQCGDCHDTTRWKAIHTGHDTGPVKFGGAHDRIPCVTCHTGGQTRRGTAESCLGCHRADDIHHGALGPRCLDCHNQQAWSLVRFFHERVGCDLRGVHRTLACASCHVGGNFTALSSSCVACHRADAARGAADPIAPAGHAGFTQCAGCHNVNFFAPSRSVGGASESVCR